MSSRNSIEDYIFCFVCNLISTASCELRFAILDFTLSVLREHMINYNFEQITISWPPPFFIC